MPDASHPFPETPRDWSDAFGALPLEPPPHDAWPRLAARLDTQRRRTRYLPAWLGVAAAAALVLAVTLHQPPSPPPTREPLPAGAAEAAHPAPSDVGAAEAARPAPSDVGAAEAARPETAIVGATQVATREPSKSVAASAAPTKEIPAAAHTRLDTLQQESARLEALLAVSRDERVGNAGAVLLADAFDAQVAGIDAALAEPAIDTRERERLWQARVDALQQAAGFYGTQRLMAAQGSADTWLVSVD